MLRSDAERLCLTRKVLKELSERSGGPWKEVLCEPQPQYGEMVFWILLYEDSDIKETHKVFCEIIAPYVDSMRPLQIALFYDKFTDNGLSCVNRFVGNDATFEALNTDDLGASGFLYKQSSSIYRATDSER